MVAEDRRIPCERSRRASAEGARGEVAPMEAEIAALGFGVSVSYSGRVLMFLWLGV